MKKIRWSKLDNAGKIFPPSSSGHNPQIFRFVCILKEEVDEEILQSALDKTIKDIPFFSSILKRGFFWYYLEETDIKGKVTKEDRPICSPLYIKGERNLLYRVNYYHKRINLEVYHALTDGKGALTFLQKLVINYLNIKYKLSIKDPNDSALWMRSEDSFDKYYNSHKKGIKMDRHAYKLKGSKYLENRIRLIELEVETLKIKNIAHSYNVTVTELIASILIMAINKVRKERDKNKDISILIPVDLRNYFPSTSMRNFFATMNIVYHDTNYDLETVCKNIKQEFKKVITLDNLQKRMNEFSAIEKNYLIRMIPLPIKDIILKLVSLSTDDDTTLALSNLGVVRMPQLCQKYIDSFSVFVSTKKIQLCTCSYQNKTILSFTSAFENAEVEKGFVDILNELNMDITLRTNNMED